MKIATGLFLKQNLFEGVLNEDSLTDEVDFSEKGKSQFIKQLEDVINQDTTMPVEVDIEEEPFIEEESELVLEENLEAQTELNFEKNDSSASESLSPKEPQTKTPDFEEMEAVMTKGMEFLTGLFQMSTGKHLGNNSKPKVKVNKETGEVSISFKMEQLVNKT